MNKTIENKKTNKNSKTSERVVTGRFDTSSFSRVVRIFTLLGLQEEEYSTQMFSFFTRKLYLK